jgi:pilus assembly protein CpaC
LALAEAFLGIKSGGGGAVEDPKASSTNVQTSMGEKGANATQVASGPGEKGRVINFLHVGGVQQVMVEVRVAEIHRDMGRQIGVNFSGISRSGNFGLSMLDNLTRVTNLTRGFNSTTFNLGISTAVNAIAGWKAGGILWTAFFDALKREGLGRILAEPNLIATSGQEASFLAGGEFPIPVPQNFNVITIEYKKFGVGLSFTPTVLEDGKIALKVAPEVSELDDTIQPVNIAGLLIPGLRVRRSTTHVELKDGQTFAIAGLLSTLSRDIINKFPVIGDIPILGTLFRSSRYQKNETELVILVTPYLVKPMTTRTARLPTDAYIEPNDFEFYLLGLNEGRSKKPVQPPTHAPTRENLPSGFGRQPVQ